MSIPILSRTRSKAEVKRLDQHLFYTAGNRQQTAHAHRHAMAQPISRTQQSAASISAPKSNNKLPNSLSFLCDAYRSAVQLNRSVASTSHLASHKTRHTSTCPFMAARISAVRPSESVDLTEDRKCGWSNRKVISFYLVFGEASVHIYQSVPHFFDFLRFSALVSRCLFRKHEANVHIFQSRFDLQVIAQCFDHLCSFENW